jgi:hypothetical protein
MTSTFVRNLSLFFLIVLPVSFLPFTVAGFDTVKALILAAFVVVGAIVVLFRRLGEPGKEVTVTLVCVLAGVAAIATTVAAMLSSTPLLSWYGDGLASNGALVSLALLGVFALFKANTVNAEIASRSIMVFFAAWVLVLVWEIIRFILVAAGLSVPSVGYFFGPGINTIGRLTDLSLFIALGVALLVAFDRAHQTTGKQALLKYVVAILAGVIMFFAKFVLSWYVLAAVGLCVICHALVFEKDRRVPAFPLAVVLVSFAMILGGQVVVNALYTGAGSAERIARIDPYAVVSEDIRPNFDATMSVAGSVLKESPVFGAGPARFSREVHESGVLGGAYYGATPVWNTDFYAGHSVMATRLVTEGVLGLLAWAALVLVVAFYSIRLALVVHKDATKRLVSISLAVVTIFAVGVMFWYPPSIVIAALLFAFLGSAAGFVVSEDAMPARAYSIATNRRIGFIHALGLVAGLLLVLAFGFGWIKSLAATHFYNRASVAVQELRGDDAVRELAKAAYFVPESAMFRAAADVQRTMALEILSSADAESRSNDAGQYVVDAVENAQKAVTADPSHYANFVSLARSLSVGMPQTASATSDAYEAAKPLAPRNPTILIEQAIIKAVAGNREEALMLVEGVLNINPNITDAQQLRDAINATKVVDVEATATSTVSGVDEGGDSEAIDSVPETTEN